MNDVRKGAATVFIATVITSAMILLSDESNADNMQLAKTPADQVGVILAKSIVGDENQNSNIFESVTRHVSNSNQDMQIPPPGPFSMETTDLVLKKPEAPSFLAPPASPEGPSASLAAKKPASPQPPTKNLAQQPNEPVKPKSDHKPIVGLPEKGSPVMVTKQFKKPFAPKMPSLKSELKATPELPNNTLSVRQKMPDAPNAPQVNAKPTNMLERNNNQPIWMQNHPASAVGNPPQMNSGINIQQQQNTGISVPNNNPYGSMNTQQYRYIPMPVYPMYQYPQVPRYNGGYYFAPIPDNQRMQRVMPMQNYHNNRQMKPNLEIRAEQEGLIK